MSDPELVIAAINAAADGKVTKFAALIDVDGADVRKWRAGTVRPSAATRLLLRVIAAHPRTMRRWLEDAGESP